MSERLPGAPSCPYCGHVTDGFTPVGGDDDARPSTGDRAVCIDCAQVAAYVVNPLTGDARLRKLTPAEQEAADADPDIQRAMMAIMATRPMGAETLPCGCIIDNVGEAFVMQPHALDCEFYLYAMAESKRRGMPVRTIMDPGMTR